MERKTFWEGWREYRDAHRPLSRQEYQQNLLELSPQTLVEYWRRFQSSKETGSMVGWLGVGTMVGAGGSISVLRQLGIQRRI